MSRLDRLLRTGIGFAILVFFGLIVPTWWAMIGLVPLITGVSGFCPLYKIFSKDRIFSKKENKNLDNEALFK